MTLEDKAARIKMLLLDVDGVLTDGRIIYDENGATSKNFFARDGSGFELLRKTGCEVGVISGSSSTCVKKYLEAHNITHSYLGVINKVTVLENIVKRLGFSLSELAFVGDDNADINVIEMVGFSACPNDSQPEVSRVVDYKTRNLGGRGCVREVIDLIIRAKS